MPRDMTVRVKRLEAAKAAIYQKGGLSEADWRKIYELQMSLDNIELYGQETEPTGNPVGVEINVG